MSDNHTDAQGELPELPTAAGCYEYTDETWFAKIGKAYSAQQMVEYAIAAIAKIRATEGQAQTSTAGQWVRCTPQLILAGVNCGQTPRRAGDGTYSHDHFIAHSDPIHATAAMDLKKIAYQLAQGSDEQRDVVLSPGACARLFSAMTTPPDAAQLADSTAPGAPEVATVVSKHGFNNTMSWLIEPALPVGTKLYAAPTAQQSLTAGGAVPEHPSTASMPPEIEDACKAAYDLAPWLAAALDDDAVCAEYKAAIRAWFDSAMPRPSFGLSIGEDPKFVALLDWCLEAHISGVSLNDRKRFDAGVAEMIAYINKFAAAPLPQVQSEALEAVRPQPNHFGRWLRGNDGISYPSKHAAQQPVTPSGALPDNDGGVAK